MSDVTRSMREGTVFGVIAGLVFAVAESIAATLTGHRVLDVFRAVASLPLGPEASMTTPSGRMIGVALAFHIALCAIYGLFYGAYCSALTMRSRRSIARQSVVGLLYGAMLWLINFRMVAPSGFPWMLEIAAIPQLVMHAVWFGLPLGVLYGTAERHAVMPSDFRARRRAPRLAR
jgi:hypothetical protein